MIWHHHQELTSALPSPSPIQSHNKVLLPFLLAKHDSTVSPNLLSCPSNHSYRIGIYCLHDDITSEAALTKENVSNTALQDKKTRFSDNQFIPQYEEEITKLHSKFLDHSLLQYIFVWLQCCTTGHIIYDYDQIFYTSECMTCQRVMGSSFKESPIYHFLIACLEQSQCNFPSHLTKTVLLLALDT